MLSELLQALDSWTMSLYTALVVGQLEAQPHGLSFVLVLRDMLGSFVSLAPPVTGMILQMGDLLPDVFPATVTGTLIFVILNLVMNFSSTRLNLLRFDTDNVSLECLRAPGIIMKLHLLYD